MPAIVVVIAQDTKPRIVAITQTVHMAKKLLAETVGNPAYYYNVQEIAEDDWIEACQAFTLPIFKGEGG